MLKKIAVVLIYLSGYLLPSMVLAQTPPDSMRPYVLETVKMLYDTRKLGGYDIHRRFTQDLGYGDYCCVKATRPLLGNKPYKTMCVAAVVETMIETINLYATKTGDRTFQSKFPASRIDNGTRTSLIPNVFKYAGTDSPGTGYALALLGLGRELPFEQLQPGDFVTLNRSGGTGHAVVFLGYLASDHAAPTSVFSGNVVGFRYFSAQGQNRPDGGFGYRNAYFVKKCPVPRGKDDDCNVIGVTIKPDGTVSQSRRLFNAGELFVPKRWTTDVALEKLKQTVSKGFELEGVERGAGLEEAVEAELQKQLSADPSVFVDGSGQ
ncbi:hypothetical protein WJ23_24585 [Burkholderia lata]|uniref:hypothetical protein n=1 Tax=Burkholderia lata (strain ATCC 17760 / DSM 23089 / LMG 22485 / NCIMB 9086 / R18194 / 383) TaxID=482957 RepID=UPI000842245B|nr:hypothetical protein [Burkholderia lata]AOJ41155.1 hypothetical protein WJ23_24585 [Burkholderia lata]